MEKLSDKRDEAMLRESLEGVVVIVIAETQRRSYKRQRVGFVATYSLKETYFPSLTVNPF